MQSSHSVTDRIPSHTPKIDYTAGVAQLAADAELVLETIFAGYARVAVAQELSGGFTQSRLLLVQPGRFDGKVDLPLVVKIGPVWLIEREQVAYQRYIRNKLSGRVELVEAALSQRWGALGYRLAGDGQFKHESLSQFYHHLDTDVVEEVVTGRLIKRLETMWRDASIPATPYLGAKYDLLLPVHLIIEPQVPPPHASVQRLTPSRLVSDRLSTGEWVRLEDFVITEVDPIAQEITLDLPTEERQQPHSHRVRLQRIGQPDSYQVNQPMPALEGIVVQTRLEWLRREVEKIWGPALNIDLQAETLHWPDGRILPNPLAHLSALLHDWPQVKIAYLHGDLNLENILVDPATGDVTLIDFANAGEDHVLHDLLHLETNVVAQLLSNALVEVGEIPDLICSLFYERLHQAATQDPTLFVPPKLLHPALKKPFTMLVAIRQAAQAYLLNPHDWSEYYRGLALHLLGALKYKNLDKMPIAPLPKQVLFLGAAAAVALWRDPTPQLGAVALAAPQTELHRELRAVLQGCYPVDLNRKTLNWPNLISLLNPLSHLSELLEPWLEGDLTRLHGHLKLADIRFNSETSTPNLEAVGNRRDYILHELLRLELSVVTGLIPPALVDAGQPPETILFLFYERLHRATSNDPGNFSAPKSLPDVLRKAFEILAAIRQRANRFLLTPEDWSGYYRGLALHFLSVLRLKELDQAPHFLILKQVTFLAAAITTDLWRKPAERPQPPNPYKGLQAFQEVDAPFFFGREAFVQKLVTDVRLKPLVTLTGPSGSGKSSVIFAGLVPQLRQQGDWLIASFRPGSDPFAELARVLVTLFDSLANEVVVANLAEALKQGEQTLSGLLTPWLNQAGHAKRLLLIVDQFEELYTLCPDPDLRQSFLDTLLAMITEAQIRPTTSTPALHLVLTLRADFMGKVLAYSPFAEVLQTAGIKLLGAMTRPDLARAIEYPAEKLGFSLAYGLVERILDDVGTEPGHLPLLEFALDLLWKLQRNGRLTLETYETIGRVRGAVTYYADQIWEDLMPVEQTQARHVFTQLVHPGAGTEDARRVATRAELETDWGLVQKLTGTRLVVTNRTAAGVEIVEVVHEALIQNWGRLRLWMETDRTFRAWQERLRVAINQWHVTDQEEDGLLRGAPLAEAEEWFQQHQADLSAIEEDFILRSITLREQIQAQAEVERQQQLEQARTLAETQRRRAEEQAQAAAKLRRRAFWLGTALIMLLFAVGLAILFGVSAQSAANRADANLATAQYRATQERQARGEAVANLSTAEYRATQEAEARNDAVANLATAEFRATLEAEARNNAEKAATLEALARADAGTNLATAVYRATLEARARGQAVANLATAQYNATLEALARNEASANLATAQSNATLESLARATAVAEATRSAEAEATAQAEATKAIQAQQTAVSQQATAEAERNRADAQTKLAVSRQLAAQALSLLQDDPSLALLLSLEANRITDTTEARDALLTGLQTYSLLASRLYGHADSVESVAFSPDGQTLASGDANGAIILWNMQNREQPQLLGQSFVGHTGSVTSMVFSPDGQTLVTGGADGAIVLWDVQDHQRPQLLTVVYTENRSNVLSVAFSPDGQALASGSADGAITLWGVQNRQQPQLLGQPLRLHNGSVETIAFSPDGQTLTSGSNDNTIILWDVQNRQQPQLMSQLTGHTSVVESVIFSPDGQTLASGSGDGVIILWDVQNRQQPRPLSQPFQGHNDDVFSLAFSPDGHILASGSGDKTIKLWDMQNRQQPQLVGQPLRGHISGLTSVVFSPDGRTLASSSGDKTIILWDIQESQPLPPLEQARIPHNSNVFSLTFSPNDQTLASASGNKIMLWDVQNHHQPQFLAQTPPEGHSLDVFSISFSPDGQTLASGSRDQTVILWDMQDRRHPRLLGQPLREHTETVLSVAFSPDGRTLASGSADGTIIFWNVQNREQPRLLGQPLNGHNSDVYSVAFNPNGQILASGGSDDLIILWDVRNRNRPQPWGQPLTGHTSRVESLVFNADGQTLASGSADGVIILWDVHDPNQPQSLWQFHPDPGSRVGSLAFSPDRKTLASGGGDGAIVLRDVQDRRQPHSLGQPLNGHVPYAVNSVVFSRDGQVLASGSNDYSVILWDVGIESWQRQACHKSGRNLTQAELNQYIPTLLQAQTQVQSVCPEYPYPYIEPTLQSLNLHVERQAFTPEVEQSIANTPTATATATPLAPPTLGATPFVTTPISSDTPPVYLRPVPLTCGNTSLWVTGLTGQEIDTKPLATSLQIPPGSLPLELWLMTTGGETPPSVDNIPTQIANSSNGPVFWSITLTPEKIVNNEVIILTLPPNRLITLFLCAPSPPSLTDERSKAIYLPLVLRE